MTGYQHPDYAQSLAEFGIPRKLPRTGGRILQREIPGFPDHDAIGCYPLFVCQDWSQLAADLDDIGDELVALSLVTDPFGNFDPSYLQTCFKDVCIPFKHHFVIDLSRSMSTFVSGHHRRYARKARRRLHVQTCQNPALFLDEWLDLYATLIKKHGIKGIQTFSRASFAQQLSVPGLVMFRAAFEETAVGMLLWYVQGDVGYYHLGASSPLGYELRVSFALFWSAIEYFAANGLRWLNLGAGAGVENDGTDGLTRFKQGWSTDTRPAYFCGRIFDKAKYAEIVQAKGISTTSYFPAYRKGEFG